jgi:ABC-type transporter Mla MlaB component
MLRITVEVTDDRLRFALAGKLAGAWVAELEDCWRAEAAAVVGRSLSVDLTGVVCIDAAGKYLLALMHESGAHFVASGCAMAALVQEITSGWPVESRAKGKT